jgi:hypothetical protein
MSSPKQRQIAPLQIDLFCTPQMADTAARATAQNGGDARALAFLG